MSEPLISGMYPCAQAAVNCWSRVSRTHTVLDDTPHGCSVTPSSLNAVAATPMHRPLVHAERRVLVLDRQVIRILDPLMELTLNGQFGKLIPAMQP